MSQPQPHNDVGDTKGRRTPADAVDFKSRIVDSQTEDELLASNNLGLGIYTSREFELQLSTFGDHIYASAAFESVLFERAKRIAIEEMAREGVTWHVERSDGTVDEKRRASIDEADVDVGPVEHGEAIWEALPDAVRLREIRKHTDYEPGKRLPPTRELLARHEMSRSKDGRLMEGALVDQRVETVDERTVARS